MNNRDIELFLGKLADGFNSSKEHGGYNALVCDSEWEKYGYKKVANSFPPFNKEIVFLITVDAFGGHKWQRVGKLIPNPPFLHKVYINENLSFTIKHITHWAEKEDVTNLIKNEI